ncbi:MAG: succinate dehydrogenase cytochrome b subunit [Chloroflexota bacterium]
MSAAVGITNLYRTSIGKKVIMAVTGLLWVGFVVFHMYGNLKIFSGAPYFNAYAEGLRELGTPLFGHLHLLTVARAGLVVTLLAHIWAAVTLSLQARNARPKNYSVKRVVQASWASQYIRWGGVAIFFFIIYHLAHFTWGVPFLHSQFDRHDPYANVVFGFSAPYNVAIYLVAVTALGFHLYHGVWSMLQTLGLNSQEYSPAIRLVAVALGFLIPVGFASVPIAILAGFVTL